MAFPTSPINPNTSATLAIPQWCKTGNKVDPELSQAVENTGWIAVSGQQYGQIPPYQWVNWTSFQVGAWLNFLCGTPIGSDQGAIFYLAAGKFDSGINILNTSPLKFFNTADTTGNYIAFQPPTGMSNNAIYTLPPTLPANSGAPLVTTNSGVMSWGTNVTVASLTLTGSSSGTTVLRASSTASGNYTFPANPPSNSGSSLTSSSGGAFSWNFLSYLYHNYNQNVSCNSGAWTTVASVTLTTPGDYAISAVTPGGASGNIFSMTLTTSPGDPGSIIGYDITATSTGGSCSLINYHLTVGGSTVDIYMQINPASNGTFSGHISCLSIIGGNP